MTLDACRVSIGATSPVVLELSFNFQSLDSQTSVTVTDWKPAVGVACPAALPRTVVVHSRTIAP